MTDYEFVKQSAQLCQKRNKLYDELNRIGTISKCPFMSISDYREKYVRESTVSHKSWPLLLFYALWIAFGVFAYRFLGVASLLDKYSSVIVYETESLSLSKSNLITSVYFIPGLLWPLIIPIYSRISDAILDTKLKAKASTLYKDAKKNYEINIQTATEKANVVKSNICEIESLLANPNYCCIHKNYWDVGPIIFNYIDCGRASSLKEALNMYENEKHQQGIYEEILFQGIEAERIANDVKSSNEKSNEELLESQKEINSHLKELEWYNMLDHIR